MVARLDRFFQERANDGLRSIVEYDLGGVNVVYLRDDVANQYNKAERADAIDESRMQSMSHSIYEEMFSENHGDLECMVMYFERVVELNFTLDDGAGVTVGLDSEAIGGASELVSDARDIVTNEHS